MGRMNDIFPKFFRDPKVPPELRDEFLFEITLSNCRRVKVVSWLMIIVVLTYLVVDFITIRRAGTLVVADMWLILLGMRSFAIAVCGLFLWMLGPLQNNEDVSPMHYWLWKVFILFALVYTAMITCYTFPLKMSLAPVYIFLLGPSVFFAMTFRQAATLFVTGIIAIAGWLHLFVPSAIPIGHQILNVSILSAVALVIAQTSYVSSFKAFMNKRVIEQKNIQLENARAVAEKASEAKSEFLATVSHEIRTPMNAILGMTEITLHTPLSSEQRDYIGAAREAALNLLDIINDILDFSRIEARGIRLIPVHFDLPAVMHSAATTIRLQAEQKGVELVVDIMSGTPRFLKGDPGRLRQIFINLLNNALKFTDSGTIRVTAGPWRPKEAEQGRPVGIRFSVKDTGTGIPKKKLQSIFQAFSQADGSSSRSYGGSGLGLSISRNLVEAMGGTIRVESRPGKGSEFIFTARFGEGDGKRATEADVMSASWNVPLPVKPSRVLLVDDNPLNVKVEKLHLDRMGMDVTTAESGTEALMLLAEEDFDLVLMDLEMPGMDGHETTRRIRNGEGVGSPVRQPDVPVLAVTAHALSDVRIKCENEGMNGFVTKPASFGDLGAAMRRILGGNWQHLPISKKETPDEAPVLDIVHAASNLGVSQAEIRHLVPNAMSEIRLKLDLTEKAVQTGTLREVAIQTHTLKSVTASIGAEAARRAAVRLENAARREDAGLCRERSVQLKKEVGRLEVAVNAL